MPERIPGLLTMLLVPTSDAFGVPFAWAASPTTARGTFDDILLFRHLPPSSRATELQSWTVVPGNQIRFQAYALVTLAKDWLTRKMSSLHERSAILPQVDVAAFIAARVVADLDR